MSVKNLWIGLKDYCPHLSVDGKLMAGPWPGYGWMRP